MMVLAISNNLPNEVVSVSSEECLSIRAPGQANHFNRTTGRETIYHQFIYQRFALQILCVSVCVCVCVSP